MSREKLLPRQFGYLNKTRRSPYANLIMIGVAAESINAVMLFMPSIEGFFAELLSISGIFLMMEFGVDAFTGIYLYLHKSGIRMKYVYLFISIFSFTGFTLMILFGLITNNSFLILAVILLIPGILLLYRDKKNNENYV
jgi:amino acid transporter